MRYTERNMPEHISPRELKEQARGTVFDVFREVSAADAKAETAFNELDAKISDLPEAPFEAAVKIRQVLINEGFEYNDYVFKAQDVLQKKQGNCLGLSCLVGALLEQRGFCPKYEIVLNPRDQVYKEENRFFEELERGEYFDYEAPELPEEPTHVLYALRL